MKITDFEKINKYLGNDKFCYILVKKSENSEISLYNQVKTKIPQFIISVNINFNGKSIALQNIPKVGIKSNAILIKRSVLMSFLEGDELILNKLIAQNILIIKGVESIEAQKIRTLIKRGDEKAKCEQQQRNVKSIMSGANTKLIPKKEWIKANSEVLTIKSTPSERRAYSKLSKAFGNKIKTQHPFTIRGNIYFADMCIPCKKVVIEIDGGYHNIESQKNRDSNRDGDFKSIGYTTIRIKNEDVSNSQYMKEIINMIKSS